MVSIQLLYRKIDLYHDRYSKNRKIRVAADPSLQTDLNKN